MESVDEEQPVINNANTDSKLKKHSKKKWSLKKKLSIIFGTIIVFIIGIIIFANFTTSAPLKVSDEFIAAIQDEDSVSAYKLMSTATKKVTNEQDFSDLVDRVGPVLSGKPELQSKEINSKSGSSNSAIVIYKIAGSDNVTYLITINLVEIDGKWQIQEFISKKLE